MIVWETTIEVTVTDVCDPNLYLKDRFPSIERAMAYAKLMLEADCGWKVNIQKIA